MNGSLILTEHYLTYQSTLPNVVCQSEVIHDSYKFELLSLYNFTFILIIMLYYQIYIINKKFENLKWESSKLLKYSYVFCLFLIFANSN